MTPEEFNKLSAIEQYNWVNIATTTELLELLWLMDAKIQLL